jgi:hypothetical protein
MRAKINLDTIKDINDFVGICTRIPAAVYITDGAGLKVSGKSLLGVMYAMEFSAIWCECEEDIYSHIERFIIIE